MLTGSPWPSEAEVAQFRGYMLAGMLDTVLIERKTGTVFNDETGNYVDVYEPLYTGPCRVQDPSLVNREETAGGYPWTVDTSILQLPVTSDGYASDPDTGRQVALAKGDQATITAIGPTTDPDLLGAVLSVQGFGKKKTHPVYRSLICEAVS